MSKVAQGAFALVPSASNLEGLTKRLLVLRAEIDAILVELVSQAMATPQGAAKTAMPATVAALAPQIGGTLPAAAGRMTVSTLFAPLADGKSTIEHHDAQEDNVGEDNPGQDAEAAPEPIAREPDIGENLEVSETVCAAVPELPVPEPALTLPEDEPAPLDDTQSVFAEAMPMVETCIDTAAPTGEADPLAEAQVAPPADTPEALPATGVVNADQPDDAVTAPVTDAAQQPTIEAPELEARPQEPAAHSDAAPPTPADLRASDSPVAPATSMVEAPAEAKVISLQARQKKHKAGLAAGAPMAMRSEPTRTGRRLAAKIAACILVLLTAATAMVASDRNAFGMVQSLPWMTPMPSGPTGVEWLLQRLRDSLARADEVAPNADQPIDDGPLAGRVGWGD